MTDANWRGHLRMERQEPSHPDGMIPYVCDADDGSCVAMLYVEEGRVFGRLPDTIEVTLGPVVVMLDEVARPDEAATLRRNQELDAVRIPQVWHHGLCRWVDQPWSVSR